jgi:riboflavin kinase/FMN adenylyltransferase
VGRKHTVPTLNLAPVEEQLPKTGVYVTRTKVGERCYDSVTNVGHKPTFGDDQKLTVETFLLNFPGGEIQDSDMEIEFLYRLRDEIKFQNPAMLKVQIQEDARRSSKFFRLFRAFAPPQIGKATPEPSTAE